MHATTRTRVLAAIALTSIALALAACGGTSRTQPAARQMCWIPGAAPPRDHAPPLAAERAPRRPDHATSSSERRRVRTSTAAPPRASAGASAPSADRPSDLPLEPASPCRARPVPSTILIPPPRAPSLARARPHARRALA